MKEIHVKLCCPYHIRSKNRCECKHYADLVRIVTAKLGEEKAKTAGTASQILKTKEPVITRRFLLL